MGNVYKGIKVLRKNQNQTRSQKYHNNNKECLHRLISKLDTAKERINELEYRTTKTSQSAKER